MQDEHNALYMTINQRRELVYECTSYVLHGLSIVFISCSSYLNPESIEITGAQELLSWPNDWQKS